MFYKCLQVPARLRLLVMEMFVVSSASFCTTSAVVVVMYLLNCLHILSSTCGVYKRLEFSP